MRIKKVSETVPVAGTVKNAYDESTKDTYSCDYINDLSTYSITEQRIGTWIDGKPLYRRTYTGQTDGSNGIVTTVTNADEITQFYGKILSKYGQYWPIPCVFIDSAYNNGGYILGNQVVINMNSNYLQSNLPYLITVEYTKTTD